MKTTRMILAILGLAILVAIAPAPISAQVATGTLLGVVTDPSRSVIPGAHVSLRNMETGEIKSQNVATDGLYRFPLLTVGTYELTVEAKGFKQLVQSNIALTGGQILRLDAHLELGNTSTKVNVSAAAVKVDTETAALNTTVDTRRVAELPLNGRDAEQLVLLTPGAVDMPIGAYTGSFTFPITFAAPVNGTRQNMLNFTLDGSDANEKYTNVGGAVPNPDALEELDITTTTFDARYGKNGGGVVNIITKSGTNQLHGDVFEFLRNQSLNATDFFTHKLDGLIRNQFGFTLGGPVVLPRLYDGRDRTFFFVSYQGTRLRAAPTANFATTIPTAAERNGDFSADPTPIIDPDTGLPFPGNQIPTGRLSNFAKNLFPYLPVPQPIAGEPPGSIFYTQPNQQNLDELLTKIDQVGTKYQLSARYFRDHSLQPAVFSDNNVLTVKQSYDSLYQSAAVNATFTLRPQLLDQVIFSFDRTNSIGAPPANSPFSDHFMGINIFAPPAPSEVYFSMPGFFVDTANNFTSPRNSYQIADNLTYVRGRHQIMVGGNVTRESFDLTNPFIVAGYWDYNGSISGDPVADLFLGKPDFFEQGSGQDINMRGTLYGFYGEDNFKVNSRLTLNLGLRWEPFWAFHDTMGRGGDWFPGQQSQVFPLAPTGILYAGDKGVHTGFQAPDLNNFAPRVGFALNPFGDGKMSIRGGYGVFYDIAPLKNYIGYGQVPPFSDQIQINDPGSDTDPYTSSGIPNPFPTPAPSATTPIPRPVSTFLTDPNRRTSYIQNWNLTIERQLAPNLIIRGSYVGTKGTKLEAANEVNPATYIPGQSTPANTDSRRPYFPEGLSSTVIFLTDANSIYHGFQGGLDWKLRSTFSLAANYTFGKSIDNIPVQNGTSPAYIDPYDENAFRGPSDFDARHRLVLSYIWDLPTPHFNSGPVNYALGHWSTSGILSVQSGFPLTIIAGQNRDLAGVGSGGFGDVAELVGDPGISNPSISQWFNQSAFALPPLGSFGNAGRGVVYGPGFWNADLAFFRDFPLHLGEQSKVRFRGDFFNAFNHVNPSNPDVNFSDSTFGQINSYRGPRIIQLAIKVMF